MRIKKKYFNSKRSGHMVAASVASALVAAASVGFNDPGFLISSVSLYLWEKGASPDRDIRLRVNSPYKTMASYLWRIFWLPYSTKLIPRHRSYFSHSVPVGWAVRVLYVFSFPAIALTALVWHMGIDWVKLHSEYFLALIYVLRYVLVGTFLADIVHLLKDGYNPIQMILGE